MAGHGDADEQCLSAPRYARLPKPSHDQVSARASGSGRSGMPEQRLSRSGAHRPAKPPRLKRLRDKLARVTMEHGALKKALAIFLLPAARDAARFRRCRIAGCRSGLAHHKTHRGHSAFGPGKPVLHFWRPGIAVVVRDDRDHGVSAVDAGCRQGCRSGPLACSHSFSNAFLYRFYIRASGFYAGFTAVFLSFPCPVLSEKRAGKCP